MFYFVPSWEESNDGLSFDDTVNQIKMFYRSGESIENIITRYMPELSYSLHQQDLLEVPKWSVFDYLQNTVDIRKKLLTIRDIIWPENSEFIYTPFRINVLVESNLHAQVVFGIGGQIFKVIYYEQGEIIKIDIFDDRGFLSSAVYYDKGYQEFFDLNGVWQFRMIERDGQTCVVMNPTQSKRFGKLEYQNINELRSEILTQYFEKRNISKDDVLIVAADGEQEEELFKLPVKPNKTILSFFESRAAYENSNNLIGEIAMADLIIVDTPQKAIKMKKIITERNGQTPFTQHLLSKINHVTPYDTRFKLGTSQQYKELVVFTIIDIHSSDMLKILDQVLGYMLMHDNVRIVIGHDRESGERIVLHTKEWFVKYFGVEDQNIIWESNGVQGENEIDNNDEMNPVISDVVKYYNKVLFQPLDQEEQIISLFDTVRLIIDASDDPNIFTQIAGISAGIPQINASKTSYVEHLKNGYVVENIMDIESAMNFYLDGLKNWNEALIYSVRKIQDYNSGSIVDKWKLLLGNNDENE